MKRYLLLFFILLVGAGGFWFYQKDSTEPEIIDLPNAIPYEDFVETKADSLIEEAVMEENVTSTEEQEPTTELAQIDEVKEVVEKQVLGKKIANTSINLDVPFTSQAPTANWEQPYQDACEEASVLMVDYYYQNKKMPDQVIVEFTLFDMVEWQKKHWLGHRNLSMYELAKYVEVITDYETEVVEKLTIEKITEFLDRGLPVIVPANGKKLANPHFSNGGPEYHMLVIKGYLEEEGKFITNDPGTRRGENYLYSYANMMESIADWDKKRSNTTGSKKALILYKN